MSTSPKFTPIEELDGLLHSRLSVPIVYVEGKDDQTIYRYIAVHSGLQLSVIECGGRDPLHKLWDLYQPQRHKIIPQVIYFADSDLYVFGQIPADKEGINYTKGYAIENDLFEDGKDALLAYFTPNEHERFRILCESVAKWYAFEIEKVLGGQSDTAKYKDSLRPFDIIDKATSTLSSAWLEKKGFTPANEEFENKIIANFIRLVRGKTIFDLLFYMANNRAEWLMRGDSNKEQLWLTCLSSGLRSPDSNTSRIKSVMQSALDVPLSTWA